MSNNMSKNIAEKLWLLQCLIEQKKLKIVQDSTARVKTKTGYEYTYKYAKLDDILDRMRPLMNEVGLVVHQTCFIGAGEHNGNQYLRTSLICKDSGDYIDSAILVPVEKSVQGTGGNLTCLRRYEIQNILGIVTEEDTDHQHSDARTAEHPPVQQSSHVTSRQAERPITDQQLKNLKKWRNEYPAVVEPMTKDIVTRDDVTQTIYIDVQKAVMNARQVQESEIA